MKFTATFKCELTQGNVACKPKTEDIGLIGLDFIRHHLKNPGLPTERIAQKIYGGVIDTLDIDITEKLSRKIGYFKNKNSVTVIVPELSLTPYMYPKVTGPYDVVWVMDDFEILQDWIADGCPLEWCPTKTEKTTEELMQIAPEIKITQKNNKNIGALFVSSGGTTTAVYVGGDGQIKHSTFETEQHAREYLQNEVLS
jgi:hypothetical protein